VNCPFSVTETPALLGFIGEFYQTFKRNNTNATQALAKNIGQNVFQVILRGWQYMTPKSDQKHHVHRL
jgi:hypothetical protein